ncbi:MAG: NAD(P)H-binding protein, partial [Nitrospinota bacterium]
MKVFLIGGTGFVGSYLLKELVANNFEVTMLVRAGSLQKLKIEHNIKIVNGDIFSKDILIQHLKGADLVINLVGIIREQQSSGITFERLHYDGVINLLDACKMANVKKIIHMSANGASLEGVSNYQVSKMKAEIAIKESGLDWTIFRPSVIFGDSNKKMEFSYELAKVIQMVPIMPIFGSGDYQLEPVAIEDVAKVFRQATQLQSANHKIFELGGGKIFKFKEIINIIANRVKGRDIKSIHIPLSLIEPVAKLLGGFSFFPISIDQLEMLKAGNVTTDH